jgi:hypothetical protein
MSQPHSCRTGSFSIAAGAAIILALTAPAVAKHRRSHRRPAEPTVQKRQPAQPDDEACADVLKNASTREAAGQLQEAKELFRSCARSSCALFVREQCTTHYTTLEHDAPTVVLMVSDGSGVSRTDVQVRVDGTVFSPQVDGRPLPIDPGMHDFSFSTGGHVFASEKILILQGQRNRIITAVIDATGAGHIANEREAAAVELRELPRMKPTRPAATAAKVAKVDDKAADPTAAPAPPAEVASEANEKDSSDETGGESSAERVKASKRPLLLPVVIGVAGVASLGAGALLTSWGRKDNDALGQCSPMCNPSALHHIRRLYYGADAAIGVGVAALAAAYLVYAINHHPPDEAPAGETALRFGIEPTRMGGGLASVLGTF